MARNSLCIQDEYTDRKDLTRLQKWRLRHPELKAREREYIRIYMMDNPEHVSIWRKNNPDKYKEQNKRANKRQRLKTYNLSEEQYDTLLNSQNNLCAICKGPNTVKHDWHVDHNHITGKTRGILCHYCNLMIGHAKESIFRLTQAIEYLKTYNDEV